MPSAKSTSFKRFVTQWNSLPVPNTRNSLRILFVKYSCLLKQHCYKSRPARLVTCAETDAVIAVVVIEFLERLNKQVVKRKPDWAAPIGVTSKQFGVRFSRLVLHAITNTIDR